MPLSSKDFMSECHATRPARIAVAAAVDSTSPHSKYQWRMTIETRAIKSVDSEVLQGKIIR